MSGLAARWSADAAPSAVPVVRRMMAALGHRALDGEDVWSSADGRVALGHLHFWTTPEEVGERQPVVDGAIVLAFDGRLDNRDDVAHGLGLAPGESRGWSDACLVARCVSEWGDHAVERLVGPFALVAWDGRAHRLILARDAVGERTLCWRADGRSWSVASEPWALLAEPSARRDLDDVYLAHHFALLAPDDGRTMFADVRELPPAHVAVVDERGARWRRYWQAEARGDSVRTDAEACERFREVLGRAVRRCLRAAGPPAILMSGGLDSTSIAALAARSPGAGRTRTYSYVFDELSGCDERAYIAPMVSHFDLDATHVAVDGDWPLRDAERWPRDPNGPEPSSYRLLLDRMFGAARADGSRVVLTGTGGDDFFVGAESWLADLLAAGRWREAARETLIHVRRSGWAAVLRSRTARRVASTAARRLGYERPNRAPRPPGWLTAGAAAMLPADTATWRAARLHRRPTQFDRALGPRAAGTALAAAWHTHRLGVETREPFRDRDVIGLALIMPAFYLYNRGHMKAVLRAAMQADLPGEVLWRGRRSDISPLFRRGVAEREADRAWSLIRHGEPGWRPFVRTEWVASLEPGTVPTGAGEDGALWQLIAWGLWDGSSGRSGAGGSRRTHDAEVSAVHGSGDRDAVHATRGTPRSVQA